MYYRVRKSWEDRNSQIGTFTVFENAKNMVDLNPGYAVFDEEGKQMYPPVCPPADDCGKEGRVR